MQRYGSLAQAFRNPALARRKTQANPARSSRRRAGRMVAASLFELARLRKMPIAVEAVRRIDELFAIEREINGLTADERLQVRRARSKPLVEELERWLSVERRKLSSKNPLAKAIDYSLKRRNQ